MAKDFRLIVIVIGVLVILSLVGMVGARYLVAEKVQLPGMPSQQAPPRDLGDQVACAMDIQVCPDGSTVSRQPPTCEFAACPSGDDQQFPDTLNIPVEPSESARERHTQPPSSLLFQLPEGSKVYSDADPASETVEINGQFYTVSFPDTAQNLCLEGDQGCEFQDQDFMNGSLRMWNSSDGVFALNPVSIQIMQVTKDFFIIEKEDGDTFTDQEIGVWKTILEAGTVE